MLLLAIGCAAMLNSLLGDEPAEKKGPPFTISKETTYLTEPLDSAGYPDYWEAIDRRAREGVTVENNAFIAILRLTGPARIPVESLDAIVKRLAIEPVKETDDSFIGSVPFYFAEARKNDPVPNGLLPPPPPPFGPENPENEFAAQFDRAKERPWTSNELPVVAKWLARNDKVVKGLGAALAKPRYYVPVMRSTDKTLEDLTAIVSFETNSLLIDLAYLLLTHGMHRIGSGDAAGATADAILLRQLAKQTASQPFMVDSIIACSFDAMATRLDGAILHRGKLTAAQIREYQARVAQFRKLPPQSSYDECDQLFSLADLTRVARRGKVVDAIMGILPERNPEGDFLSELCQACDWDTVLREQRVASDEYHRIGLETDWKRRDERLKQWEMDRETRHQSETRDLADWARAIVDHQKLRQKLGRQFFYRYGKYTEFATGNFWRSDETHIVQRELLRIAFALAQFRADHDRYPASLADLTPKYLASLPKDPYTSKDYLFRTEGKGLVVYSVGPDEKDDLADPEIPQKDIFLRMW